MSYYVSAIDGDRCYVVCGPYPDHESALRAVDTVRDRAYQIDPRAHWMAWGTCSSAAPLACPLDP